MKPAGSFCCREGFLGDFQKRKETSFLQTLHPGHGLFLEDSKSLPPVLKFPCIPEPLRGDPQGPRGGHFSLTLPSNQRAFPDKKIPALRRGWCPRPAPAPTPHLAHLSHPPWLGPSQGISCRLKEALDLGLPQNLSSKELQILATKGHTWHGKI